MRFCFTFAGKILIKILNFLPAKVKRHASAHIYITEPAAGKPIEEMTNAELWAVFFQYLTDEKKRDKIIEIINRMGLLTEQIQAATGLSPETIAQL